MAGTGLIGSIGQFDSATENWDTYVMRVEVYFAANNIKVERQKNALLALIGPTVFGLLQGMCEPGKTPMDFSYDEIKVKLGTHLNPEPLLMTERFNFHQRKQLQGEKVATFCAELQRMARHCKFEAFLDQALRDQLVVGLADATLQRKLIGEKDPTFDQARVIAVAHEATSRDVAVISGRPGTGLVNKITSAPGASPRTGTRPKFNRQQDRNNGREKEVFSSNGNKTPTQCYRCGSAKHLAPDCKFKTESCRKCNRTGHIAKMCRSKEPVVKQLQVGNQGFNDFVDIYNLSSSRTGKKFFIDVKVNGRPVTFEFDTGAALTCLNGRDFKKIFPDLKLKPPSIVLQQYDKSKLGMCGEIEVDIEFKGRSIRDIMHVVPDHLDSVFGVPWLDKFLPDIKWTDLRRAEDVHQIQDGKSATLKSDQMRPLAVQTRQPQLQRLLEGYPEVFKSGIGELKEFACRIHLKEDAQPIFHKPRPVPLALRDKISAELDRLQQEGILEPVTSSDWATPIVPVVKPDGGIRICGDYKITVNPVIKVDQYTLPRIEELFAIFQGGVLFSKIDISEAYLHMPVDERDRDLLTINTHKGLFRYRRMNYGISSAPAIWQRSMETLLAGIEGVGVFLDDIVVTGRSDEEHLDRLQAVLQRLSKHGLRVNHQKCKFFEESITYCGHRIDRQGLHKTEDKIRAVMEAPRPTDVTTIKSFLGLVTYYGRFVEKLATLAHSLYQLFRKGVVFKWSADCEKGFLAIKREIAHYDPALPLVLATDASPAGLGAVLSHRMPDGN